MAQATFSIRMDESLKNQFDNLCKEFGMNASTGVSLEDGRSAFNALRKSAEQNDLQDLSLDEINAEIQLTRNSKA